ncbi:MAG: helix-turn-helix domain-containing protein [Mycobacteriales bacterium]
MQTLPYGADDLANTRFASSLLGHLLHGVHNSVCSRRSRLRQRWWAEQRRHIPAAAISLVELVNHHPREIPSFLLPPPHSSGPTLSEELDLLLAASPNRIIAELAGTRRPVPRVIEDLRHDPARALRRLADGARALYHACMAADWPDIRRLLHADLAYRTNRMMSQGPGTALTTLHPTLAWQAQTLVFTIPGPKLTTGTAGRGFILMPCAFGRDSIHPSIRPDQTPTLIYSARQPQHPPPPTTDTLATLLGGGKAKALRALSVECTTSELARRLYIGKSTASEHVGVLRAAGLITTERDGQRVRHSLTPLGAELISANPAPHGRRPLDVPVSR